MLNKIQNCYDQEELHNIGLDIDMSLAPRELKVKMYEAIEKQLKSLNLLMAESSEINNGDVEMNYRFED